MDVFAGRKRYANGQKVAGGVATQRRAGLVASEVESAFCQT